VFIKQNDFAYDQVALVCTVSDQSKYFIAIFVYLGKFLLFYFILFYIYFYFYFYFLFFFVECLVFFFELKQKKNQIFILK
jgi:hypothetical protein